MCADALRSLLECSVEDIQPIVYVDIDDPWRDQYSGFPAMTVVGEPRRSGAAIRYMIENHALGDMFYFGSDDFRWITKAWDQMFREAMPSHGLSVLYGTAGDSCNPCFTRKWVDTVGLFPDYFKHFGPDTWYADIAKRAGVLVHVPYVRFSHQRVQDETYHRTRADGDGIFAKRMLDETQEERQQLAEKVKAAIRAS